MSVSKWRYTEQCDGDYCCGDCDLCSKETEEERMRWIPTSERLPERGKAHRVLVTVRHKDPTYKGCDVAEAYYDYGEWEFVTGYQGPNLYVSAWMPMPEPYRGDMK